MSLQVSPMWVHVAALKPLARSRFRTELVARMVRPLAIMASIHDRSSLTTWPAVAGVSVVPHQLVQHWLQISSSMLTVREQS
jgi:hypothetical protein